MSVMHRQTAADRSRSKASPQPEGQMPPEAWPDRACLARFAIRHAASRRDTASDTWPCQNWPRLFRMAIPLARTRRPLLYGALLSLVVTIAGPLAPSGVARTAAPAVQAPPAAVIDDGARSIYGLSGTFSAPCLTTLCDGAIGVTKAARMGSAYLRTSVNLSCVDGVGPGPQLTRGNHATLQDILRAAAAARVIPILNFVPRADCPTAPVLTPDQWAAQLSRFVRAMHTRGWYPASRWIYFEIGNEPNLDPERYSFLYGSKILGHFGYADVFRAAAQGVQSAMGHSTKYRVLTAGMITPTALVTCTTALPYPSLRPNYTNLDMAADAIAAAARGPHAVPLSHLGVSVHPYKYNTPEVKLFWRNYYYWGTKYSGACFNLNNLIDTWTQRFPDLPIFFTESNWSDQPQAARHCTNLTACEGTYMIDLFTWLHHHGYDNPRASHLRVTFFRGADADLSLGLFGYHGSDKPFWTGYCPLAPAAAGWKALVTTFTTLTTTPCY